MGDFGAVEAVEGNVEVGGERFEQVSFVDVTEFDEASVKRFSRGFLEVDRFIELIGIDRFRFQQGAA